MLVEINNNKSIFTGKTIRKGSDKFRAFPYCFIFTIKLITDSAKASFQVRRVFSVSAARLNSNRCSMIRPYLLNPASAGDV
jgi:hypothetical protein